MAVLKYEANRRIWQTAPSMHWLVWMSKSVALKLQDTLAEGRIIRKQLQNDGFGVQACQLYSTGVHIMYSSYVAIYLSTYNN